MIRNRKAWATAMAAIGASAAAACGAAVEGEGIDVQSDEVIGGTPAAVGEFPYQAQLNVGFSHACGGVLLNDRHVLTAQHCTYASGNPLQPEQITIVLGERDRNVNEGREQVRTGRSIARHQNYSPFTAANDIAVIELSSPVTLNQWVNTIALPDGRYNSTNALTVSGWGWTAGNGSPSTMLMRADLPFVDQGVCASAMEVFRPLRASMLCAGRLPPTSMGACHTDSGGPLASTTTPRRLFGLVDWGKGGTCDMYTVFTRVSDYVPWIRQYAFNEAPIACSGQTLPTDTEWKAANPELVYADVDTSQCNYWMTPEYFTSLGGASNLDGAVGFNAISNPTATSFRTYVYKKGGVTPAQAKSWQWNVNFTAAPRGQLNSSWCTGSTTAGSTNWVQASNGRIYVDVDTSQCARATTPRYFTSLKGNNSPHYLNGITSIYSPTPTGFRVYLQWGTAPGAIALTPALANANQWHVGWAAAPTAAQNTPAQCVGNSASGFWNWTQAGTDVIYTTVNTSACGKTYTPLYFTALRGNGIWNHSDVLGGTTVQNVTPTSFRVYLRQPGLTPLIAGLREYFIDWAAYP